MADDRQPTGALLSDGSCSPTMAAAAQPAAPRALALHASASTPAQWQALGGALGPAWELLTPRHLEAGGGHGAGRGVLSLADMAHALWRQAAGATDGVHLVGHSFGGVVALQMALQRPQAVRSLVLYEPVLLALLLEAPAVTTEEREVFDVAETVRAAARIGGGERLRAGAARFIDYWGGTGSWAALSARAQAAVAAGLPEVALHFQFITTARTLARRLPRLHLPTLLISGSASTASAARVAARIASRLPRARWERIEGAGHMGPLTHAAAVNERIVSFLDQQARLG